MSRFAAYRTSFDAELARQLLAEQRGGPPVVIPNVHPFVETGHRGDGRARFLGAALDEAARGGRRRSWRALLWGITARRAERRARRSRWCPAACSCDTAPAAPRVD